MGGLFRACLHSPPVPSLCLVSHQPLDSRLCLEVLDGTTNMCGKLLSCFPICVASASIGKGATLGGGPPSFNVGGMMFGGSAAGTAK